MLISKVRPAMMDLRLVFQSPTKTTNTITNEDETTSWSDLGTFAGFRYSGERSRGGIGYEAEQEVSTNVNHFVIQYSSKTKGIDSTYRFYDSLFPTEYYYVNLVEKVPRERKIHIRAERKDNE